MRCSLPFALAETIYPGTLEEKLRGEIGAYVWLQQNCTDIRVPRLYGFSISSLTVVFPNPTSHEKVAFIDSTLSEALYPPTPSRYAPKQISFQLPTQYMLLEYIGPDTGEMLSKTWAKHRNDPSRRKRLFHGLARIIVSLSRVPQPRIGSFEFRDDCTVTLTNRPAFATTVLLENDGAHRSIPARRTYSSTGPFVADMITLHDNYFYHNQSAVDDEHDCSQPNGAKDWEVTCLLDLEWLCALPPETLSAPYWLTGQDISDLVDDDESQNLTEYNSVRQEFMRALKEEESKTKLTWPSTSIMEDM
ncbi:hypothetical protein E4U53_003400 [Claviceps sorghi]|nr:hypothetical protein E4U53_003400 [Claviceps sorghi]